MRRTIKIQAVLLLLILGSAGAFFFKSHGEEQRLTSASASFSELYNDRLLAEHVIYKMTEVLHREHLNSFDQERMAITLTDDTRVAREFEVLLSQLSATKLTMDEITLLERLRQEFGGLVRLSACPRSHAVEEDEKEAYIRTLALLDALAEIQISEGTRLQKQGQVALASSMIGLKFQTTMLVLLLLSLLILVKNTWVRSPIVQKHELN